MALIFDLDGTLIDSVPLHLRAMKSAIKSSLGKGVYSDQFIKDTIRYPLSIVFKLMEKKYKRVHLSVELKEEIMKKKAAFFNSTNIGSIKFFPKVATIPTILNKLGIKFCIVTSMSDSELVKFDEVLKFKKISKLVINPPGVDYEKPNPYTLEEAVRVLDVDKKITFYVGDSPYDAIASRRAGINFIGVYNRKELANGGEFYPNFPYLLKEIIKNPSRFSDRY